MMDEREQKMLIDDLNFLIDRKAERIRALESDLAAAQQELAAARQYPPDMQRPQLEPPPSKNDEARRWADYADYLEKLFVAQNFKLGDAEADIRIALRDLEKCASSLNIDQSGPESISGRLSGFLWAVKQLLAEAKKDSERLTRALAEERLFGNKRYYTVLLNRSSEIEDIVRHALEHEHGRLFRNPEEKYRNGRIDVDASSANIEHNESVCEALMEFSAAIDAARAAEDNADE